MTRQGAEPPLERSGISGTSAVIAAHRFMYPTVVPARGAAGSGRGGRRRHGGGPPDVEG